MRGASTGLTGTTGLMQIAGTTLTTTMGGSSNNVAYLGHLND